MKRQHKFEPGILARFGVYHDLSAYLLDFRTHGRQAHASSGIPIHCILGGKVIKENGFQNLFLG
jgi:hypothetical protein